MVDIVTYYKPTRHEKGDSDFKVTILRDGKNICDDVADSLFRIAYAECDQPGLEGEPFEPNFVYEFANGLLFRLWDDGLNINVPVLEFAVLPELQHEKPQILCRIPRLLQMAGVREGALEGVKAAFQPPSTEGDEGG